MDKIEPGKIYALNLVSQKELLAYIDTISSRDVFKISFISRLPHRRMIEHFDLERVESYWLTKQQAEATIYPEVDEVFSSCKKIINNNVDLLIIEGIEWLISLHGFDNIHSMVMDLHDLVYGNQTSIIASLANDVLDDTNLNRWRLATTEWSIPNLIESDEAVIEKERPLIDEIKPSNSNVIEQKSSSLAYLTPILREGFSHETLRKRTLQWRRMGLDVSELDTALFSSDEDKSYDIYKNVEQKVRRAIELDNRLDLLEERGWKSDVIKLRFRIRQLTGFDEVEKRIDEII